EDDEDGISEQKRAQWDAGTPYVVLQICAYRSGNPLPVTSIGDIDFYADGGDWVRGTFTSIASIPAQCEHLRALARDLGLN
ncbi:MAG TPA: hypothetical protein VFI48_11455, partial [Hyphomicrobiaceae bacterium]|nr:hypothetical protein [Hyphomicrobiaceae bacterium]